MFAFVCFFCMPYRRFPPSHPSAEAAGVTWIPTFLGYLCHVTMEKMEKCWPYLRFGGTTLQGNPGLWKDRHPSEVTRRVQLLCLDLGGSGPPGLGDGRCSTFSGLEMWLEAENRNGSASRNFQKAQKPMGGQSDQSIPVLQLFQ
jgi:hypothetical protein